MTDQPFPKALSEILAEREWSIRQLSRQTRLGNKKGLAHASIGMMIRGELPPSRSAIEQIAGALQVPPDHFPEYRLEIVRDQLNWRRVGVPAALAALQSLHG